MTAVAARAETSSLLGCRSCGTGLRELPLEELHSPYVLPRLHVTHIYIYTYIYRDLRLCASSPQIFPRVRARASALHPETQACTQVCIHEYMWLCARGTVMYSVCASIYAVAACFQFPAGTICSLLYLLAFVGGTAGSRYGRTPRTFNLFGHSIILPIVGVVHGRARPAKLGCFCVKSAPRSYPPPPPPSPPSPPPHRARMQAPCRDRYADGVQRTASRAILLRGILLFPQLYSSNEGNTE